MGAAIAPVALALVYYFTAVALNDWQWLPGFDNHEEDN